MYDIFALNGSVLGYGVTILMCFVQGSSWLIIIDMHKSHAQYNLIYMFSIKGHAITV